MTARQYHLHGGKKGAALAVRVIPMSERDEIVDVHADGTVYIRLKAPMLARKENQALAAFLAEILGVPKSKIEVVAGLDGQDKLVSVLEMEPEGVQRKIMAHLTEKN